ncbi:MAG: cytochrome C [Sedimenticola sp.]|nr:MAG: cytochrome C [Sedimenticola sp.]
MACLAVALFSFGFVDNRLIEKGIGMVLIRQFVVVAWLCFFVVMVADAQSGAGLSTLAQDKQISELQRSIETLASDPVQLARLREEGRERTILCRTCHGVDGISVKELVPNLAGQNPVYIVDQFQRFGDGRRFDYLMSGLAKSFSDEDKIRIALYYSGLVAGPTDVEFDSGLLSRGKKIFLSVCSECHGQDGHGQQGYARLAGQRQDYVVKMLQEFRDRTGRRSNPWMSAVALKLDESQMEAVAAYVASLR